MVGRSLSRGRFDRSPGLDSAVGDSYDDRDRGRGALETMRSMKKSSYTPRATSIYATPPRSPLDRSVSRARFGGRESSREELREREYEHDDHRNPMSEGRSFSHSNFSRSASTMRERMEDDDSLERHSVTGGNNSSSAHARDVLSKMRSGSRGIDRAMVADRGMYSEPKQPLQRSNLGRSASHNISLPSPRRRLDLSDHHDRDDLMYGSRSPHHENHDINHRDVNVVPASKYEVMGLKEELKKKDEQATTLRREIDEMTIKYEESMSTVRTKLVATFKEDMQEMKTEWEEAFQRLKDESDTTQRALEMELNDATHAKSDLEGELNEFKADFRAQMEEEKSRSKERMEELKISKEEDLERLRSMYEEHLDTTKKTSADAEADLKDEIHVLLEENEKVKMCYGNLESEMSRFKEELDELNTNYQNALNDNARWQSEAANYKEELEDVLDENDKHARHNKTLEDALGSTKGDLERMTSNYQRSQAEKNRFENEYNATSKERDEVQAGYNDLVKKLDGIQEERTLESRYTEALVKQRDNMNDIIENSQAEIDEMKSMNVELSNVNRQYAALGKEFHLVNSDAITLREELIKAEQYAALGKEFHLVNSDASTLRAELVKVEQYVGLAKEYRLTSNDGSYALSLREELAKAEKMKERLETLGRERERYNATVKALKVDLKALHGGNAGPETSLQEHMRLLNEKWDSNESRLKQIDPLKSELEESIQLLEENAKGREQLLKEHHSRVDSLERDLQETQTALVKMEREKITMEDRISDYELLASKKTRITEELEDKCEKLQDRLEYIEDERQKRESQCKSLVSDNRSLQAELDKLRPKKAELEDALDKMDSVKSQLKKKLESAYYDLEETQRELNSIRNDHDDEMRTFEAELSKLSKQKGTIGLQEEEARQEIKALKEMLERTQREQSKDLEDAQAEVAESYKVQLRLMEEKHADQERRNSEYLEQKNKDEIEELRANNKELEQAMKEQKESLDQKSMAEIKRRGEHAKTKQELEILRSKERHLETHVNQLEEHISKVVADYEARLQSSGATVCSTTTNGEVKGLKKQVRELEKKLEVSSAAMKQIGKSSLLMEKENERLKNDKNELKLKLKKLVDCAEKFGPK